MDDRSEETGGLVDVFVDSTLDGDTVLLVAENGDEADSELGRIPTGTPVMLQNGDSSAVVTFLTEEGGNWQFNSIQVGQRLARKLGLADDTRYRLSWDGEAAQMARVPVSRTETEVAVDSGLTRQEVSVGGILLIRLGIPGHTQQIRIASGSKERRLTLDIPDDESSKAFRLPPAAARELSLRNGRRYSLSFDQTAGRLTVRAIDRSGGRTWESRGESGPAVGTAVRAWGLTSSAFGRPVRFAVESNDHAPAFVPLIFAPLIAVYGLDPDFEPVPTEPGQAVRKPSLRPSERRRPGGVLLAPSRLDKRISRSPASEPVVSRSSRRFRGAARGIRSGTDEKFEYAPISRYI